MKKFFKSKITKILLVGLFTGLITSLVSCNLWYILNSDSASSAIPKSNNTATITSNATTTNTTAGTLKVSYIDVGQADSILIQQGSNSMLIDAGTTDAASTVKNYIAAQGITKLDYLVATHPHEDHIGGMDYVLNSFQIGNIYMPKATTTTKTFTNFVKTIKSKGLTAIAPTPCDTFKLGEATCTILAPNSAKYEDLNNYSIVIKITFGNNSFLFEGDAQAISEKEMLNKGFDVKADGLKVGHHGSNSSTTEEFLNAVSPKFAIISAGKGNTYGHPHAETMNRLKAHNIPVYRTDECGTIVATSDGNNITFNTHQGDYLSGSK